MRYQRRFFFRSRPSPEPSNFLCDLHLIISDIRYVNPGDNEMPLLRDFNAEVANGLTLILYKNT